MNYELVQLFIYSFLFYFFRYFIYYFIFYILYLLYIIIIYIFYILYIILYFSIKMERIFNSWCENYAEQLIDSHIVNL